MDIQGMDDSFRPLGRHLVRREGDTIWMRYRGDLSVTEMAELFEIFDTVYQAYGYAMCLGDATHSSVPSADARRYQAERLKQRVFPSHTAIYGASAVVSTLATLTQRAIEMITKKPTPLSFHRTEAAARERLDRERPLMQSCAHPPGLRQPAHPAPAAR